MFAGGSGVMLAESVDGRGPSIELGGFIERPIDIASSTPLLVASLPQG